MFTRTKREQNTFDGQIESGQKLCIPSRRKGRDAEDRRIDKSKVDWWVGRRKEDRKGGEAMETVR